MKLCITKIKIIALICMIMCHIAIVFSYPAPKVFTLPDNILDMLEFVGKIAFPLFAFSVANGWIHTKNKEKYFMRMVIFAIISQVPYIMAFYHSNLYLPTKSGNFTFDISISYWLLAIIVLILVGFSKKVAGFSSKNCIIITLSILISIIYLDINGFMYLCDIFNIFYTFIVALFMIYFYEKVSSRSFNVFNHLFLLVAFSLSVFYIRDSGNFLKISLGILLIFLLYISANKRWLQSIIIAVWGLVLYGFVFGIRPYDIRNIYDTFLLCLPVFIAAIIVLLYDESKVPKKATWFYWAYPAHLLILGIVNYIKFH